MAEYNLRLRNPKMKTITGEDLTLEVLLQQIKDVGGEVIDKDLKSAQIKYEGTIPELYGALQYDKKDLLISPLKDYELPDTKKSIKA